MVNMRCDAQRRWKKDWKKAEMIQCALKKRTIAMVWWAPVEGRAIQFISRRRATQTRVTVGAPASRAPRPRRPGRRRDRGGGRRRGLAARPRHAPGRARPRARAAARDRDRRAAALRAGGGRDAARRALPVSMLLRDRGIIMAGGASGIA